MGQIFTKKQTESSKQTTSENIINVKNKSKYFERIAPESDEYKLIERICLIPHCLQKIEKIKNDMLYTKYMSEKCYMAMKYNVEPLEKLVFYGTGENCNPYDVCSDSIGLDFRNVEPHENHIMGFGLHFFEDALSACKNCYRDPKNKNISTIILAKILPGNSDDKQLPDANLRLPRKDNTFLDKNGLFQESIYDSIVHFFDNNDVLYVLYENYHVIPLYLITFDESQFADLNFYKWFWINNCDSMYEPFSPKENYQIELNYRKCILKFEIPLIVFNSNEQNKETFLVNLQKKNDFFMVKSENEDEEIKLKRILIGIPTEKFKAPLYSTLKKDLDEFMQRIGYLGDGEIKIKIQNYIDETINLLDDEDNSVFLTELDMHNTEFEKVQKEFIKTLPTAKIVRIEKVYNKFIRAKYLMQKMFFAIESIQLNEYLLFHGTRANEPQLIYRDHVGFDMRYSNTGMWGKANYFAKNAGYSHENYKHITGDNFQIFAAHVLLGNYEDIKYSDASKKLIKPPENFQSVKGNTNGSDVFMIYENNRAYPEYLITYQYQI